MSVPTLRGDGIVLRPLVVEDADALFAAHSDPAVHEYWSSPAHASVQETRTYIAQTLALPGAHAWAITETGDEALGRIGLFVPREGVGEIGVIQRRDAQGRGLVSKALALVIAHGFDALKLNRIAADIDPDNSASRRLFERAGFVLEGILRANWVTHLGVRDTALYALVRD